MTIAGILLIPSEGDPHGLLAEGPCGYRPPTVVLCCADERLRHGSGRWHLAGPPCREHPRTRALVLWSGEMPVTVGLAWAWHHTDDVASEELGRALVGDALDLAEEVATWRRNGAPLGTLVLVDADGREVMP